MYPGSQDEDTACVPTMPNWARISSYKLAFAVASRSHREILTWRGLGKAVLSWLSKIEMRETAVLASHLLTL